MSIYTKQEYFRMLSSKSLARLPVDDQELQWFDEWLETTPEGRKANKESEGAWERYQHKENVSMFGLRLFFREHIDNGVDEFRIKILNEKEIEIIPSSVSRTKKINHNSLIMKI